MLQNSRWAASEMVKAFVSSFEYWLSKWYIWALIVVMVVLKIGPGLLERARLRKAGMPEIDKMTGLEFEKFLQILFSRLGYQVERTPYVGDQGGDLVLVKNGERVLVQAKRHSKPVGNKAVQEAAAARPHYKCHRAMVVANQEFTGPARELAASNQVELWGRQKLAKVILDLGAEATPPNSPTLTNLPIKRQTTPPMAPSASQVAPPRTTTAPAPTCKRCGKPMVLRESTRGKFWGCSGYPKCRFTAPLDASESR